MGTTAGYDSFQAQSIVYAAPRRWCGVEGWHHRVNPPENTPVFGRFHLFQIVTMLCGLVYSLSAVAQEPTVSLRFLGNAQLPPIVWSHHGEVQGVAVDLTYAAAQKSGLSIHVAGTDWQQAQEEVRDGKADALVQINPNPQRLAVYDFSEPLLQSNFHIFRKRQDVQISGLTALFGRKVGVEAGGFPIGFLTNYKQINVVVFPDWGHAFAQLEAGQIDAVFVDRWVGEYELYMHKITDVTMLDPAVITLESSIAVKKGNTALLHKINEGLRAIQRDGTRQSILDKWQAKEVVLLTRESIDRAVLLSIAAFAVVLSGLTIYLVRQRKVLRATNSRLEQSIAQRSIALKMAQDAESAVKMIADEQKAILDSHIIGIVKVRRDRTVSWANPAFATMFGYEQGELIDKSTRLFFCDDEAFDAVGRDAYVALSGKGSYRWEQEYQRKDGSRFFADVNGAILSNPPGESIWCFVDISERKRHEERIRQLAFFDPLTQLPNRRLFDDRLAQALAQSERNKTYGTLMVLDLDNFKPLNDTHGHAAGDWLLQEVARRISNSVRETDTVARFGGDEFVIICGPLVSDRTESAVLAKATAEKVRLAVSEPYSLNISGGEPMTTSFMYQCTACVGVALFLGNQVSPDELFKQAHAAMYQAKDSGRDRVKVLDWCGL